MIDKKSYPLSNKNYFEIQTNKTQIVIGHTGRKNMYHYNGWVNRNNGNYNKTVPYTIDRDGKIYEHFNPKFYTNFINKHNMGESTIPILLTNVGWLKRDNLNDRYCDWLGHNHIMDKDQVIEKKWRGYDYWENYTEEQLESVKKLTEILCNKFNINDNCIGHNVFNEDVDMYEGIVFRSNYYQEFTDVSPAFKMNIFIKNIQ